MAGAWAWEISGGVGFVVALLKIMSIYQLCDVTDLFLKIISMQKNALNLTVAVGPKGARIFSRHTKIKKLKRKYGSDL